MIPIEGYFWFRSDDEAHRMLYSQRKDGWEIVRLYESTTGWRAIIENDFAPLFTNLHGEWIGPLQPSDEPYQTEICDCKGFCTGMCRHT